MSPATRADEKRPYQTHSLKELLRGIVRDGEQASLQELLERRWPILPDGAEPRRVSEHIQHLMDTALAGRRLRFHGVDETIERAADLTMDKFLALPARSDDDHPEGTNNHQKQKDGRTDCRKYWAPVLAFADDLGKLNLSRLEEELRIGHYLARHLAKHFRFSLRECKRKANPGVNRYAWQVNGSRFYLYFPKNFPGRARRKWLEANVDNPAPSRPGERERVQRIIDERLAKPTLFPLDEETTQSKIPNGNFLVFAQLEEE